MKYSVILCYILLYGFHVTTIDRLLFSQTCSYAFALFLPQPLLGRFCSDLIYEASRESNKKYILLRLNPDAFTAQDGENFRSCFTSKPGAKVDISDKAQWKLRTSYFKSKLEECMQLDPKNEELFPYVDYMFYDGFDTSLLPLHAAVGSSGRKRKRGMHNI